MGYVRRRSHNERALSHAVRKGQYHPVVVPHATVPLFPLGVVVRTQGGVRALQEAGQGPQAFLGRHVRGDWGELDERDRQKNVFSVQHGFRILSAYTTSAGERIWIITEADRSATTILLPDEY